MLWTALRRLRGVPSEINLISDGHFPRCEITATITGTAMGSEFRILAFVLLQYTHASECRRRSSGTARSIHTRTAVKRTPSLYRN